MSRQKRNVPTGSLNSIACPRCRAAVKKTLNVSEARLEATNDETIAEWNTLANTGPGQDLDKRVEKLKNCYMNPLKIATLFELQVDEGELA